MRFEHDTYDVDVYSLCESAYYRYNNDEYDYVLECVNDWIMNGYNDNILLEDIVLNEAISTNNLRNLIKRKFHKLFPEEDFDTHYYNFLDLPESDPIHKFFSHTMHLSSRNSDQNDKNLLRFHPDSEEQIYTTFGFKKPKELSSKEIQQAIDAIDITPSKYDKEARKEYRKVVGDKHRPIVSDEQKQRNRQAAEILKTEYYPLLSKMKIQHGAKKISDLPQEVQNTLSSIWNKAKETENPSLKQEPTLTPATTVIPQPQRKVETKTQHQETQPKKVSLIWQKPKKKGQPPAQTPPTPSQQEPTLTPATTVIPQPQRKVETKTQHQETQPNTPSHNNTPVVTSNDNNQSRLSRATTWMKNNKVKGGLGVVAAGAAIGGSIYAYKRFKNKPKSVIAKRIQALRGIYHKFMINAQRNPHKANLFKRIAAKILSVIDKLLHYLQNKADGR